MRLGVVCGLEAEARALGKLRHDPNVIVGISAAQPDRASSLANEMIEAGAEALISWGICGALDPDLPSGALIVPEAVVDPDGQKLKLIGVPTAPTKGLLLAGSDTVVPTPSDKARLLASTHAAAVDMETHRVARVSLAAQRPCMAIRAVSDPATRALPPGTENALDAQGRPRILPVFAGLVRHPGRLRALLAAKRDLDRALETLALLGTDLLQGLIDSHG